jgi:class 3 adenylate cyclase
MTGSRTPHKNTYQDCQTQEKVMTEDEAKERLAECLKLRGKVGYLPKDLLSEGQSELRTIGNDDWVASCPQMPRRGILLKSDGTDIPFFGALGQFVPQLGWPVSREYILASTSCGRYQVYERGLAVWEEFEKGGENIGYPIRRWESVDERARTCLALVAFFDLRGFTNWSNSKDANSIQRVIENLEKAFQDAFSPTCFRNLFTKSTGDGFMVVSEAGWYEIDGESHDKDFQTGHAKAFCIACAETIQKTKPRIPEQLAVGCGITSGWITQLYLLGRRDYIGPQVNEASKIQSIAYNELCISDEIVTCLKKDEVSITGYVLPGKGIRVGAEEFLSPTAGDDSKSSP